MCVSVRRLPSAKPGGDHGHHDPDHHDRDHLWSWWQVQDVLQSVYVCPSEEAAKPGGEGNGLISITQVPRRTRPATHIVQNISPVSGP